MKKIIKVCCALVLMLSMTACQSNLNKYSETTTMAGFDTMFQLIGYTKNEDEFKEHFETMKHEAYRMHQLFDIYNDYEGINNLKTVNDNAGLKPVTVDPEIINLLKVSQTYSENTDGLFDITIGSLLKVWHEYREQGIALNRENKYGPSPSIDELEEANQFIGWDKLEINEKNNTVYLNDKRASLDVGAIAKGYAVEQIALKLEANGLQHGIVNGGGNVRTINGKPDGSTFNVGITNPDKLDGESLLTLQLKDSESIVTSGDYERFFIDDQGNHQHHIINPHTLYPTKGARSVTIVHPNSELADALSTVFTIATFEEAQIILDKLDHQVGVVWVFDSPQEHEGFNEMKVLNFNIYYTENIEPLIKK